MGDLAALVEVICLDLNTRSKTSALGGASPVRGGWSRHQRLVHAQRTAMTEEPESPPVESLVFRSEVEGVLERYRTCMRTPVRWMRTTDADHAENDQREREIHELRKELAKIVERHAPHMVMHVWASPSGAETTVAGRSVSSTCPACAYATVGSMINAPGASGACEVCQSVVYDHAINLTYQQHHTIGIVHGSVSGGGKPSPATSHLTATNREDASTDSDDMHQVLSTMGGGASVDGHHHARSGSVILYQRRTQFRAKSGSYPWGAGVRDCAAMAQYQGKATRMVPTEVTADVRAHLENLRHLIDVEAEDPRLRYANVTRVHVLCILRASGNGRYSRWYKEAFFLHAAITLQPPPDLSDIESTLLFMFGIRNLRPHIFFLPERDVLSSSSSNRGPYSVTSS